MLLRIETLTTLFLTLVILLGGCAGCAQKTVLKGIEPKYDYSEQSKYGPVEANRRKPAKLEPFPEQSFENLIEQFKADVAANRGDPAVLAQKRKAITNPSLLWDPTFVVPKVYYVSRGEIKENPFTPDMVMIRSYEDRDESLFIQVGSKGGPTYKFLGEVFYLTQDQEKRMIALKNRIPEIGEDEWRRQYYTIAVEGLNSFTAAKVIRQSGSRVSESIGIEFAERAMRDYPNSSEAMLIWVGCHSPEQRISPYRELLKKFPNMAQAHNYLGLHYLYRTNPNQPELAIPHFQKAMQLDSRITNHHLGVCYCWLDEWEKTIAFYQGLSEIEGDSRGYLRKAQFRYTELRSER